MTPLARRRLWFGVFILAVFSLGAVAGGVLADRYRLVGRRPFGLVRMGPAVSPDFVNRVSRELELTPKQRQHLEETIQRMRPRPPRPGDILDRMSSELDLTPEQRTQLQAVFQRNGDRLEKFRIETAGKFDALRNQLDHEIAAILTPEQRVRFDADRKRRERDRPPGEPSVIMPPPR